MEEKVCGFRVPGWPRVATGLSVVEKEDCLSLA